MKPAVIWQRSGIQLSYELPSSLYDTHVYPRQSSNGSTVIVYGHESGVKVVWYAGRKFKTPSKPQPKSNGSAKDDPMVIDLDDDDETPQSKLQRPQQAEFEETEDEVDSTHPYHDVLRELDIALGPPALSLAVPQIPSDLADASAHPTLLENHAVVAVACADLSIRLVLFPLLPPPPGEFDLAAVGGQIVKIFGTGFHQDLITSIALTYTGELDDSNNDADQDQSQKWSLLVASTSCTGSGLLLIHQVPITDSRLSTETSSLLPIQRQHLRSPLTSPKLAFNPSPYPNERHATLLITVPNASYTKVYQVFKQQTVGRSRRGSVATMDSTSSTRSTPSLSASNGRFLLTLLPDFPAPKTFVANQRRKSVIDAKWVLGGRAILGLLQDGEWGVWDLEAAGPASSSNPTLIKGQSNIAGIVGGAWTTFATRGIIPLPNAKFAKEGTSSTGLIPATPHTRRVQAEGLFQGSGDRTKSTQAQSGHVSTALVGDSRSDESVIINYGAHNLYIPSILTYWKSDSTRKGSLSVSNTNSVLLPALRVNGQPIKSVSFLPYFSQQQDSSFGTRSHPNFLVSTTNRLILWVNPLTTPSQGDTVSTNLSHPIPLSIDNTDQSLLQKGVLDVDGMDRLLEDMESPAQSKGLSKNQAAFVSNNSALKPKPNFGKSVGFAQNFDVDMGPEMPSPGTSRRLQSSRNKSTERRLFS